VNNTGDRNELFDASSMGNFLAAYAGRLHKALLAVDAEALDRARAAIELAGTQGNHIYAIGNGGSAAIADHLCCDLTKGTDYHGCKPIVSTSLAANMPLYSAIANDLEFAEVFSAQLGWFGKSGDVLLAISSSGNSENIVRAAGRAKALGMTVIGLSGFAGGRLREQADIALHVPVENYGVVEDAHQALMHVLAQYITARRKGLALSGKAAG
jgi:phosphoheptose isomerase